MLNLVLRNFFNAKQAFNIISIDKLRSVRHSHTSPSAYNDYYVVPSEMPSLRLFTAIAGFAGYVGLFRLAKLAGVSP